MPPNIPGSYRPGIGISFPIFLTLRPGFRPEPVGDLQESRAKAVYKLRQSDAHLCQISSLK
jgi:hypothetical protein